MQKAQAKKTEFENKALKLQSNHSLQKDAVAKIAQQFIGRQVHTVFCRPRSPAALQSYLQL